MKRMWIVVVVAALMVPIFAVDEPKDADHTSGTRIETERSTETEKAETVAPAPTEVPKDPCQFERPTK